MADLKISQLPAATVPLAGTEVLPIVQTGTTKQATIDSVRAGVAVLGANTFTAAQEWATGAAVASASTINLNTATGNRIHITGTTTINTVTLSRGPRTLIFDGVLTLTHNGTTNNLPGAANITTAVGDRAIYESDGTTVYCVSYIKASGLPVVSAGGATTIASGSFPAAASVSITDIPANYVQLVLQITGASAVSTGQLINVQVSTDNGSSFDTTSTNYMGTVLQGGSTPAQVTRATLVQGNSLSAAEAATGTISLFSYQGGTYPQFISRASNSINDLQMSIGHYTGSTSAVNALRINWSGGVDFDAGSYVLKGIS